MEFMTCFYICCLLATTDAILKREYETDLQEDLLTGYNRNVVPKDDASPLQVNITMNVMKIRKFDEIEEVLSTRTTLDVTWIDPRLSWNVTEYGNVTQTEFKQTQIWLPDINVGNLATDYRQLGNAEMYLNVLASGFVKWQPVTVFETTCHVDTRYFPFDHQECLVLIVSWVHSIDVVNLTVADLQLPPFFTNPQWEMKKISHTTDINPNGGVLLRFKFHLKRRPMYYTFTLLVPMFALSVLNCFGVLVPKQSGEGITYSITVFLSYMVLMTFTTDYLPRSSTEQPILVTYIVTMLCLSLTSSIYTTVTVVVRFKWPKSDNPASAEEPSVVTGANDVNETNLSANPVKGVIVPVKKSACCVLMKRIVKNDDILVFVLVSMTTASVTLWAALSMGNAAND